MWNLEENAQDQIQRRADGGRYRENPRPIHVSHCKLPFRQVEPALSLPPTSSLRFLSSSSSSISANLHLLLSLLFNGLDKLFLEPSGAAGVHGDGGVRVADALRAPRSRVDLPQSNQRRHGEQSRHCHRSFLGHGRGDYVEVFRHWSGYNLLRNCCNNNWEIAYSIYCCITVHVFLFLCRNSWSIEPDTVRWWGKNVVLWTSMGQLLKDSFFFLASQTDISAWSPFYCWHEWTTWQI